MPENISDAIEATLRRSAAILREAEVPFILGGGLASWARGGPRGQNDLDLFVKPEDAHRALDALVAAGMRPEQPPEDWLLKAWDGDVLVDLIHGPTGLAVDDDLMARAEERSVLAIDMKVLPLEDLLVTKLLVLDEHTLDYRSHLEIARSLREQIDWEEVRARTQHSPYARAFFTLIEELGILPSAAPGSPAAPPSNGHGSRVEVRPETPPRADEHAGRVRVTPGEAI